MSFELTTVYGGLKLRNPIVVGSCPLTSNEQIRRGLEKAGAGAIVLPSLFEEQIFLWNKRNRIDAVAGEEELRDKAERSAVDTDSFNGDTYLACAKRARAQSSIPILASLNGACTEGWVEFARALQETGVDGIELNLCAGPACNFSCAADIETSLVDSVAKVERAVDLPVFVKIERMYTSLGHLARRLLSGAQGIVLFGRQPDVNICLDNFDLKTGWDLSVEGSVVQILGHLMQVHTMCPAMPIAACGGIGTSEDLIKVLLAGADIGMVTSAIYRDGADVIRSLSDGLTRFMEQHHFRCMADMQAARPLSFDSAQQRIAYVKALTARLEKQPITAPHVVHGDLWGHVTVE